MYKDQLPVREYPPYFSVYLDAMENVHLFEALEIRLHAFIRFVREVPMDKIDFRYAEGKWTLKDIIQHLIDTERIFAYRALRIARNDQTPLPGFEEGDYADEAQAGRRSINELLSELSEVRFATLSLFKSFSQESMHRMGVASGKDVSVRALGFVIIAHQDHHQRVFEERYL
jgi:hypothetical protein